MELTAKQKKMSKESKELELSIVINETRIDAEKIIDRCKKAKAFLNDLTGDRTRTTSDDY